MASSAFCVAAVEIVLQEKVPGLDVERVAGGGLGRLRHQAEGIHDLGLDRRDVFPGQRQGT